MKSNWLIELISEVNWYSHGARYYDPQLARWHASDPLSELYASSSTYSYVRNNPVNFIDPNGMYESRGPSADERSHIKEGIIYHTSWQWNPGRPQFYSGADDYFLQYSMQNDASGGWRYDWNSETYYNAFGGGSVGANDFNQYLMPAFHDPSTTWYGAEAGRLYQWSTTSVGAQQLLVDGMNLGMNASPGDLYSMSLQSGYRNGLMADGDPPSANGGGGKEDDGTVVSFAFDFAFLGGGGFEIGRVEDKFGGKQWFLSGRGNLGLGIGIGLNISSIYAAPGQTFVASDFIGKSNEWNYGLGIGGFQGGNKNSNDFSFDGFLNYGSFYTEKGASYAFPLGPKFGVWWSNTSTVRW